MLIKLIDGPLEGRTREVKPGTKRCRYVYPKLVHIGERSYEYLFAFDYVLANPLSELYFVLEHQRSAKFWADVQRGIVLESAYKNVVGFKELTVPRGLVS